MLVSAPAKLIVFGEWGVTQGGTALGTTLSRRFFLNHNSDLPWECRFSGVFDPRTAQTFFEKLLELSQHPKLGQWTTSMEFRDVEGLGSSSALVSCFLKVLNPHQSQRELWIRARHLIRSSQNPRASGFDAGLQIWGGSQVLRNGEAWSCFQLNQDPRLIVVHTGSKVSTGQALSAMSPTDRWVGRISESVEGFLKNRRWADTIAEHDELLRELGVVPIQVMEILDFWKKNKWIEAGKTTGAGGGDALIVWVIPEAFEALENDIVARGFWIQRAPWESDGLRVENSE